MRPRPLTAALVCAAALALPACGADSATSLLPSPDSPSHRPRALRDDSFSVSSDQTRFDPADPWAESKITEVPKPAAALIAKRITDSGGSAYLGVPATFIDMTSYGRQQDDDSGRTEIRAENTSDSPTRPYLVDLISMPKGSLDLQSHASITCRVLTKGDEKVMTRLAPLRYWQRLGYGCQLANAKLEGTQGVDVVLYFMDSGSRLYLLRVIGPAGSLPAVKAQAAATFAEMKLP